MESRIPSWLRLGRVKGGRLSSSRPTLRLAWLALAVWASGAEVRAQDRTPFPEFDGRPVYVTGVPDRYAGLGDLIAQLERTSPQSYYVVVVKSSGSGPSATREYVDALSETWRHQAARRGLKLDPERSVIIAVALDNRQVALHASDTLRQRLNLHRDTVERELIRPAFLPMAKDGKFPEAIAALLKETDRWIAAHEVMVTGQRSATGSGRTAKQVPTAPVPAPPPPAVAAQPAKVPQTPRAATAAPPPGNESRSSMGSAIAGGILVGLIALIAVILGLITLAHRRVRGRVQGRLKEIRSRATDLMDRLDALKERLKLLPVTDPDFQGPMSGETLALHHAVQAALGQLWDRWLKVMEELDRAEKLAAATASPFQRQKLHDAEAILEQKGVFEEIEAGILVCTSDMDRLNQAHESARSVLEAIGGMNPKLEAHREAVGKLGLPATPYDEERAAIQAGVAEAGAALTADPIGTRSALEALRSRTEGLVGRLERVAGLFGEVTEVATALEDVKRQVGGHRAQGLRLVEEGGNPDELLGPADQAQARAMKALRAGDPDSAARELESARSMVQQARSTIEQVQKARAYCAREQPNRLRETERLRAALPEAESYHRELERGFAPGSWQAVARSLDQTRALLATFDRLAEEAEAAASATSQRYLAGARLLEQLAQQQRIALRLMSGLGEQLNALRSVRGQCQERRKELESRRRTVEGYFRQHDPILGAMARQSLAAAREAQERIQAQMEEVRPDWPAVSQGLAQALEEFAIARSQAEADVGNYERVRDEYGRARQELERVAALLAGRREDRVAANRHFRSAAEVLDQVGLDLSAPQGEWSRLLEQVRGAVADLEQAENLARQDFRLASQAQAVVDDAARSIRQARTEFAMGGSIDTSAAESALDQARQLFQAQDYERAIERAGEAVQQARRSYQEAVQQASWRQSQAEADRRRWEASSNGPTFDAVLSAGAAAAAAAAGALLARAAQEASAPPEPPPPPEPMIMTQPDGSDSAQATWESDSGQGSW